MKHPPDSPDSSGPARPFATRFAVPLWLNWKAGNLWPWRWLPGSLFGRNLLLIFVLVAVAEISILLLFRQWIQEPRVAAMQRFAVQEALQQRALLQRLDAAGRAHWQRTLGAPVSPQAGVPDTLGGQRFLHSLAAELRTVFGQESDLRWHSASAVARKMAGRPDGEHDGEPVGAPGGGTDGGLAGAPEGGTESGLWLGLRIEGQWFWYKLDHSGIPGNLPPFMLSVTLASGLLALLAAALIQRRINQPLQELAQAAVAFGRGAPLLPHLPSGSGAMPLEIAQLARSMQQMAQDLEAAGQERALMLAGVSHDLRTPLTKMRLAVEILAAGAQTAEDAALLQGMVTHISAANSVIEQFIAFARSGSDEALQEVDVAELLHSVLQELTASERYRVTLTLPLDAGWRLVCRPVALRRALGNLLENALRYGQVPGENHGTQNGCHPASDTAISGASAGSPGGSCIELVAGVVADHLLLSVQDRGPGMPPEALQRMRQPFTRMVQHSALAGCGLGLAIVERIARLHHGHLDLLPREGGGLVAQMVLPLHPV